MRLTGRRYRRCNWVRFLDTTDHEGAANLRCFKDSKTTEGICYETSEAIPIGGELRVCYEDVVSSPRKTFESAAGALLLASALARMVSGELSLYHLLSSSHQNRSIYNIFE